MRRPHRLAGPLALAIALLAPITPVTADGIAPGVERRDYSYEVA